jgi:hypothetical protein
MTRTVFAIILAALLVALPAAAIGQQKQPGNLSLAAGATTVKFGGSVDLTGKLSGPKVDGRTVTLREDPFPFGSFDDVASTATDTQGNYAFSRAPGLNTRYQTRQGGNESEVVTVAVRPVVGLRVGNRTPVGGRRVRFAGRVCPEHDGASLAIQRRSAPGRWRTVRRAELADAPGSGCSSYARRVRVRRDGVYRTFLAAHADHAAGHSRRRRIDVQ